MGHDAVLREGCAPPRGGTQPLYAQARADGSPAGAVVLFGPSEAALYAVPLAFGALLAAATYGVTLILFKDRWLAAAAGLVTALSPVYLLNSSWIVPDTGATATFTTGFLCLLLGARGKGVLSGGRWPGVWAVSAGVFFGWTVLVREFHPILAPAVIAAMLLFAYTWRRAALVFVTAAATAALDPLYTLLYHGDLLLHARLLIGNRSHKPVSSNVQPFVDRFHEELQTVFDTVAVLPHLLLTWNVGWVFLAFILVFAVALVVERDRRLLALGIWVVTVWGFMAVIGLGSLPSGRWILNITNIRYWYPLLPPLVIGALAGGFLLARRFVAGGYSIPVSYVVVACLATAALVPGVAEYRSCDAKDVWASAPRERWYELRHWLAGGDAKRYDLIRADPLTTRLAPIFTRTTFGDPVWSGEVMAFRFPRKGPIPSFRSANNLVLIHKDRFRRSHAFENLRADWSPVFVSGDGMLVLLARRPAQDRRIDEVWWHVPDDLAKRRSARGCGLNPYAPTLA